MRVRIKAKAQNAILAAYADKCGSIRAAAESLGVTATTYGKWLNFHSSFRGVGGKGKGSYSAEKAVEMIKILETETGHRAEEIFQLKKSEMNLLAKPRVYEREVSRKALEDYASHTAQRLEYQPPRDEEISLPDAIRDCLQRSKLSDRYKQVIIYKFGLDGQGERTCKQIAEMMGVGTARAAQMVHIALDKLRTDFTALSAVADYL